MDGFFSLFLFYENLLQCVFTHVVDSGYFGFESRTVSVVPGGAGGGAMVPPEF